jgi:hypothetical protein
MKEIAEFRGEETAESKPAAIDVLLPNEPVVHGRVAAPLPALKG